MENRDPNVSVLLMPTKHHLMSQTFQTSCTGAEGKLIYKNKSLKSLLGRNLRQVDKEEITTKA